MNVTEYVQTLNNPNAVQEWHGKELERIISEFPYFQSARALYLKKLYSEDSFRYNFELKKTAAYTTDRSVLFDFITSNTFTSINKRQYLEQLLKTHDIEVVGSEVVSHTILEPANYKLERSILESIQEASLPEIQAIEIEETSKAEIITGFEPSDSSIQEIPSEVALVEQIEANLEIGKPLEFTASETHSFTEWLQLAKKDPIERTAIPVEEKVTETEPESISPDKKKKLDLIDRFIELNPKIPPIKSDNPLPKVAVESRKEDQSYLMTETLARVYLEQKKFSKAIQAYQILILKYPEKSSFFADRISEIKILQQNNNK